MAETLGSIVDKLITVDLKMWHNQELLYEIRRMTFEQFEETFCEDSESLQRLFNSLKKACYLNVQRNDLIAELDTFVVGMLADKEINPDKYIKHQHKTY